MATRGRRKQRWCAQVPLTPLMEGPGLEMQEYQEGTKKESSWEVIREWFRTQRNINGGGGGSSTSTSFNGSMSSLYGENYNNNNDMISAKRQDLRLLLGVLGCPLAPIPLDTIIINSTDHPHPPLHIKDIPIETSTAHYIIHQYLAASGCLKSQHKNMYAAGMVKMRCCETEVSSGKSVKTLGGRRSNSNSNGGENGCFVLWQIMTPGMWSLELVVAGNKVLAGSDGKIVWRHTPWLGTHAAKGPHRPLRRFIQGLDPKSTAKLFGKAVCLGEKRIGEDDCFVLKVAADREAVMERNEGAAEVIRHVLYGYFSQKSGLVMYMEDSHLTRVVQGEETVYWETTIGSSIGEYREVDGLVMGHEGRTVATVFRFGDHEHYSRTRMEEVWRIDDVEFNVPGLSFDSFIPPADISHQIPSYAAT